VKALPTLDRLHELFEVRDGNLVRRVTTNPRAKAGDVAGTAHHSGYIQVNIARQLYWAHRIVYALHYGVDPGDMFVDHINHDRTDNRPENLRLATNSQNLSHRAGPPANNTSGVRGVSWHAAARKWQVHVKKRFVGLYETLAQAEFAANKARAEILGEFA
jgi:hypothetical protein